jgi:hypothetical protein
MQKFNLVDIPHVFSYNSVAAVSQYKRPHSDIPKLPNPANPMAYYKWQKDMCHFLLSFPGFSPAYLKQPPSEIITPEVITDAFAQIFDYAYTRILHAIQDNDQARLVLGQHYKYDVYTIWHNLQDHFFPKDWDSLS